MEYKAKSIRPFIGARDYEVSKNFYRDLGFEEVVMNESMSLFAVEGLGFYLQRYYTKDWVDNTMLFLEVDDVYRFWKELVALDLPANIKGCG